MTYPVRNQSVQNTPGHDFFDEDSIYDSSYDVQLEGDFGLGDEYVGGDRDSGETAPLSAQEMRRYIQDLLAQIQSNPDLPPEEKRELKRELNSLKNQINSATAFLGERLAAKLVEIQNQLGVLEARITGSNENFPIDELSEDGEDTGADLRCELKEYKTFVQNTQNIPQEKKDEYLGRLDQWMSSLDLKSADAEVILEQFEEMKTEVSEASIYSLGAQCLSQLTGTDAEEIENQAKSHGLDLGKLPNPPTKEVLEFLNDVSPELASKLQAVEEAVKARNADIEAYLAHAKAQNAANLGCTSDNDNTDMTAFQKLFDLKWHQDQKSKDVSSAMKAANEEIINLLKSLYPGQADSIVLSAPAAGEGWEAIHQSYLQSDKISFSGTEIDVFNSSDGKINCGSPDGEAILGIPVIRYDWEGSGDWEDGGGRPTCTTYGDYIGDYREKYDDA